MKLFVFITNYVTVFFLILITSGSLQAVDPQEMLRDPDLEQRARNISKDIRCVVCQNQSIDDSDATLARDLRVLVRQRLISGDTDQEVIDYLSSRYGDFVLLKPPVKSTTLFLWLGPVSFLIIGLFWLILYFQRQRKGMK